MSVYDITKETITELVEGDILNCPFSNQVQSVTLPPGIYQLEAWGASSRRPSSAPGKGGYAKGKLSLDTETNIYIYVGGRPAASPVDNYIYGGWNGGGASLGGGDSQGGGGATDFCLVSSNITPYDHYRHIRTANSYNSRLLVAGGAGGGYSSGSYNNERSGGYCPAKTTTNGYWGNMTSGGNVAGSTITPPAFGYGATSNQTGDDFSGGGGGWYGGGSQGDSYGGGGSSFVWCDAYKQYAPSDYSVPESMLMTDVDIKCGNDYGSYLAPTTTPITSSSNEDGYARITVIEVNNVDPHSLKIPVQSNKLIYNGQELSPIFKNYKTDYMTMSGSTTETNVGNYQVVFSLIDPNNSAWEDETNEDKIVVWKIQGIPITTPVVIGGEYTGSTVNAIINNFDSSRMTKSGTESAIGIGKYSITFSLLDKVNTCWEDQTTKDKTVYWYISNSVDITKNELNPDDIQPGFIIKCPYTGQAQTINLPKGDYLFEVWGAQGGSYNEYIGGFGGYSAGSIGLEDESTTLYLYSGGCPPTSTSTSTSNGGFNGGGKALFHSYNGTNTYCQPGGGASDIRVGSDSLYARVIVAGGGGGSSSSNVDDGKTKAGGGVVGLCNTAEYQATQNKPGTGGGFGVGANGYTSGSNYKYASGGAGGGWYGGGAATTHSDTDTTLKDKNAGGSGYVYTEDSAEYYPSGCLLTDKYYLTSAVTTGGNQTIIDYSGTQRFGNVGNGFIRITVLQSAKTLDIRVKQNNVWIQGIKAFAKQDNIWKEIIQIKEVNHNGD